MDKRLVLSPGDLRHCGRIERFERVDDEAGGYTENWVPAVTEFHFGGGPVSGYEMFQGQAVWGSLSHVFKARWRQVTAINSAMRLVWGNRVFDIRAVLNSQERNRVMILLCDERGTNAQPQE
jgi:head-tail adaptor